MMNHAAELPPDGQFLIYRDGATQLQVRLDGQTVWLTQAGMAELFQTTPQNITLHIKAIYNEGELDQVATCKDHLQVRQEGARKVQRSLKHYKLEVILAVGYRVQSGRGTAFRQWATARLSELLRKGFTLDDERIKAGRTLGEDYFAELLSRIRDIRASERKFYQKITDIYATSIDYQRDSEISKTFFQVVQNKLHWAIHGQTAAEIVRSRADASKPNMGLTTWKNAPAGPIRKTDVDIAKNYLSEEEIAELNRIVTMYLDYAEDQARRKKPMHMVEWIAKLDAFLEFNERNILTHAGKFSHKLAREHAERQFAIFDDERLHLEANQPTSDFDHAIDEVRRLEKQSPETKPNTKKSLKKKPPQPGE